MIFENFLELYSILAEKDISITNFHGLKDSQFFLDPAFEVKESILFVEQKYKLYKNKTGSKMENPIQTFTEVMNHVF